MHVYMCVEDKGANKVLFLWRCLLWFFGDRVSDWFEGHSFGRAGLTLYPRDPLGTTSPMVRLQVCGHLLECRFLELSMVSVLLAHLSPGQC